MSGHDRQFSTRRVKCSAEEADAGVCTKRLKKMTWVDMGMQAHNNGHILSLIISFGGNVSVFIEAVASVLWRLVVFLLLVDSGFMPVLYSDSMSVLGSGFMPIVDFMSVLGSGFISVVDFMPI
ncbi:hypothetical protein ACE6H2_006728 [Prunus campanulata]